jgi:signal transduction histidine kinase
MSEHKYIYERILGKQADFEAYDFTQKEIAALTAFFDLAQEFDHLNDLYFLCVSVVKVFFDLDACLYLIDPKRNALLLVSKTEDPLSGLYTQPPDYMEPSEHPYYSPDGKLLLTIRGKKLLIDQLPFKLKDDVLGVLEIYPASNFGKHEEFFFEKYANRIGFNIHNRFLYEKNIEHLKFIRSLVTDIEHNIIVPNMIYKLFLKNLKGKVSKNIEIEKLLKEPLSLGQIDRAGMENLIAELTDVNRGLTGELENIEKHYKNTSLFLETLLRRSHFDQGRLTLRTKLCNMKKDVVQPQLEHFTERFKSMGISVDDRLSGIPDEEIIGVLDVGLMAQVYANLFSNALKYTQAVSTYTGDMLKYISYGHEIVVNFFGPGKDGVKYNVFSTGQHIPPGERDKIFEDEYRGSNASGKPGTGHGLAFIKNAVEIHGGVVGYEATQYGNNFYFILPR